jgi:large subunit ribosomal protein L5
MNTPRLAEKYKSEIVPAFLKDHGYTNIMSIPRLEKIVVSMGVGKANENKRLMETAVADLTKITGQKVVVTVAKKSVSNFRLREGYPVGCMVTLRGARMFEFLDRLICVAIPRIRDFRGLKPNSFDDAGNFNMGLSDQLVFPEIQADRVENYQGMNITMVVRRSNKQASHDLLKMFGVPFRTKNQETRRG